MVFQKEVHSAILTHDAVHQGRSRAQLGLGKHVELAEKLGGEHDGITHQRLDDIILIFGLWFVSWTVIISTALYRHPPPRD